jgi:hypothetical protein
MQRVSRRFTSQKFEPVFCALLALSFFISSSQSANAETQVSDTFRATIESDWKAQEERLQRVWDTPEAIQDLLTRTEKLLDNLRTNAGTLDLSAETVALEKLRTETDNLDKLNSNNRVELYKKIRWTARNIALRNPLIADKPIAFLKQRRYICQMLHEYMAFYYDEKDIAGGGVFVLERPGVSDQTRDLTGDSLPRGNYTTLALSFDARTLYFGFADRAPEKPEYFSDERRSFHLFSLDTQGGEPHQLTEGLFDDTDPCPLPDGGLAFISTRRGGFGRCHNPWEPLPTATLHRMDKDGRNIQTLSFHETNEWNPFVLNDGRIVYTRWDYVDRSAANFHGLWTTNPDGSNPIAIFGNYTHRINALYQAHAIPGSKRIAFIAGGHHSDVGGALALLDPTRVALDPETGEDRMEAIETLTPEVCFPEAPDWPQSYFHSPWPLSEDIFLTAFSFDPLPGMGPNVKEDTQTGLYYLDRFGNLELLYRDPEISSMYPIPLTSRPVPPVLPSSSDATLKDQGTFLLTDVNRGHFPLPASRPIRSLRIFQVLPKTASHISNKPRIGYANAEIARMLLGTVPVESDGSAYFLAPAHKPLYFQAVDEEGRAVQSMRSITYLQAGEQRGCVGCHEPRTTSVKTSLTGPQPQAFRRPPSRLKPGPDGSLPMGFPRLVQPILDRNCVRCHDGSEGEKKSPLVLTGEPQGDFSEAYESLRPFVRWYEWGDKTISAVTTWPGQVGADASPLMRVLEDATHGPELNLTREERNRLLIWLDGNAPFYGAYEEKAREAQKKGKAIEPPEVQ